MSITMKKLVDEVGIENVSFSKSLLEYKLHDTGVAFVLFSIDSMRYGPYYVPYNSEIYINSYSEFSFKNNRGEEFLFAKASPEVVRFLTEGSQSFFSKLDSGRARTVEFVYTNQEGETRKRKVVVGGYPLQNQIFKFGKTDRIYAMDIEDDYKIKQFLIAKIQNPKVVE